MNKEFWLNKVMEECGEVITAICKIRNYGEQTNGYNNQRDLEEELGDLQYCIDQLILNNFINDQVFSDAWHKKKTKINDYLQYSLLFDHTQEDIKQSNKLQKANDTC